MIAPGDVAGVALAIERVLDLGREPFASALARASAEHAWPVAARSLQRWISEPLAGAARLAPRGAAPRTPAHRARAAGYLLARPAIARFGLRSPAG